MRSGTPAVDWGDGSFVDLLTGDFFEASEHDVSHRALDSDLETLRKNGALDSFDDHYVYFLVLPDRKEDR